MNIIELVKMRRRIKELPSRYFQILYTLTKYGLAQFVTYVPLFKRMARRLRKKGKAGELVGLSLGEKLCRIAVELGPTFIKFGQLLSSRKDLLPEHILEELESLREENYKF